MRKKQQNSHSTLPNTIDSIINSNNYEDLTYNNNKLICLFLSPVMFIFSISSFILNYFYSNAPLHIIIIEFTIFIILGISFENIKRMKKRIVLSTHLVALLASIMFMSFAIQYYPFLGPSVWVLGFIMMIVGILHNSSTMLVYIGITFFITGNGIKYYNLESYEDIYIGYSISMTFLLAVIFIVAFAIHNINSRRMDKVQSKIQGKRHIIAL